MKKILCLIDRLGFGGAERQIIGLAAMLKQRAYQVSLLTYDEHDFTSEQLEESGLEVIKLHTGSSKWSKIKAVRRHIHKNSYDTIIAYKNGATSMSCLLKMMGGKFHLIVSERNTTQRLTLRERMKFWLYRQADYIVPNAQTQGEFIKKHYANLADKTLVITNYTDTSLFSPNAKARSNNQIRILTVARVATQKNVIRYIEAAKKIRDAGVNVSFHWFGNVQIGQDEYARQCKNRVKELMLADVFVFHPASSEIVKEYQACDFFCLPSLYEGYPNVLCEAMCCGKPVLCSRVCDNPYIVEDGGNGMMFNPMDEEDMAQTIIKMCKLSEEQRASMGKRSRKMAEEKFSVETFVKQYIHLIEA